MRTRTLTAVLQQEGDYYIAECLEIGTAAQGRDVDEALANLRRATQAYARNNTLPVPSQILLTTFEVDLSE